VHGVFPQPAREYLETRIAKHIVPDSLDWVMANEKLHIHETIRISVRNWKEYLDHFCGWGPITLKLYDMHCLGLWATVGRTDAQPETIVMWELDGLDALARMLSGEFAFLQRDDAEILDPTGGESDSITRSFRSWATRGPFLRSGPRPLR
jgi:hypothetical protein